MIYILPCKGLCNRFRAMLSAFGLSRETGMPVSFIWIREKKMNCRFDSIFQPIPNLYEVGLHGMKIYQFIKSLRKILVLFGIKIFNHSEMREFQDYLASGKAKKHLLTLALSYSYFHDGKLPEFNDTFKLQPELQNELDSLTAGFAPNMIGIHIRRTDHKSATKSSPVAMFIKKIEEEIKQNPETKFYLASDDAEVVKDFQSRFGDIIMNFPGAMERNSEAGIKHAIIELYALSRCTRIWGSFHSTYSEFAAIIGKIPLEVVCDKTADSN